jgi:hypothetical protein
MRSLVTSPGFQAEIDDSNLLLLKRVTQRLPRFNRPFIPLAASKKASRTSLTPQRHAGYGDPVLTATSLTLLGGHRRKSIAEKVAERVRLRKRESCSKSNKRVSMRERY